jgi:hypothetical protein
MNNRSGPPGQSESDCSASFRISSYGIAIEIPNKKMELTTKAEPIFRKFKYFNGFCVSSS